MINHYLDEQKGPEPPPLPPSQEKYKTLALLPPFIWPEMDYEVQEYAEISPAWKNAVMPNKRMINSLLRTHYTTQGPMGSKCPWIAYYTTVLDGGLPALQRIANDIRDWLEENQDETIQEQSESPREPMLLASWKNTLEEWETTTEELLYQVYHESPDFDAHFQKWWGIHGINPSPYTPDQAVQEDNLYRMYMVMGEQELQTAQTPTAFFNNISELDFLLVQTWFSQEIPLPSEHTPTSPHIMVPKLNNSDPIFVAIEKAVRTCLWLHEDEPSFPRTDLMAEFLRKAYAEDQETAVQQVTTLLNEGSPTDLIKVQHDWYNKVLASAGQATH